MTDGAGATPPTPSIAHAVSRFRRALQTPNFQLEPRCGAHAQAFAPLYADDRLYEWISLDRITEAAKLAAWWTPLESGLSRDGTELWLAWAIFKPGQPAPLGMIDADVVHESGTGWVAANLGYYVFPHHWNQGVATEAVGRVVEHLVGQGVRRIHATVTLGNQASARLLQRLGFACERRLPNNDCIRGVWMDDDEYVFRAL